MLHKAIFESPEFTAWINSSETLEIFLDSLDECLIHVRTVARLLINEFAKYPRSRLHLRIACRTAEWPRLLSKELARLWGEQNFAEYELAPLTRQNVYDAAVAEGRNADVLLREIDRLGIAPLAMKPLTLIFLLRSGGSVPQTQEELYHQGCLRLCSYENLGRLATGNRAGLDNESRLAIAERIAAITMFAKRSAIFIGSDDSTATSEDITITALARGVEQASGHAIEVTPQIIREVLQTSLFTGRAGERMGWAHWTFAEFLAARYIVRNQLSAEQIGDLVMHPDTPDKVVPQLHETAAWLASMDQDFMTRIMRTDPQVLLASTIMSTDAATREKLTSAILDRFEKRGAAERDPNFSPRYDVLKHPNLAGQLRPILVEKKFNRELRRVALDIVEACEVAELYDDLVTIALDKAEEWYIRHLAAFILSRLGGESHKKALLPLLDTTEDEDPEDELRGDALLALWPGHISAARVFAELSKKRHGSVYGTLTIFIVSHLLKSLRLVDLPIALEWVAEHPAPSPFDGWHGLRGKIMRFGWEHWQDPKVLAAFAKAATPRLTHYAGWFGDEVELSPIVEASQAQRVAVIRAVIQYATMHHIRLPRFWGADVRIVSAKDLPWLLAETKRAQDGPSQREWARVVRTVFDWQSSEHVNSILLAMAEVAALRDEFGAHFAPVELGSDAAREMQETARRAASRATAFAKRHLAPVTQRVGAELDKIDAGDIDGWWRVNLEFVRRVGNSFDSELIADLTSLPAWQELDKVLKDRCIAAAEKYVNAAEPKNEDWFGTNTFYRPAAAGYRALRLLLSERPGLLETLTTKSWEKWSAIILGFPEGYGTHDIGPTQQLARLAYSKAPAAITAFLLSLIDKENRDHGAIFILKKVELCWDAALLSRLVEKIQKDETLKPQAFEELLSAVAKQDTGPSVQRFAIAVINRGGVGGEAELKAVKAAKVLLELAPGQSWPLIWDAVQKSPAFGRRLFAELSHAGSLSQVPDLARALRPTEVGDLFFWLEHEFPRTEDPREEGGHVVTARESIAHYRDALLTGLRESGSQAAVDVLRNLARLLPSLSWMEFVAADADRQRLRRTWKGVDPSTLFAMAESRRPRFIESPRQLLDRLVESLQRLEARLHGDTPAVPDLWDGDRPKDEDHLSNYIKRHLSDDLNEHGIIANREVQIRKGELTDIHVDAVRRASRGDPLDIVTVIVEAKGCWNKDLKTAMRDQLRDRYLKENQCSHGLYVVGWYLSERWTKEDYRLAQTPKLTLEGARQLFDAQAAELSVDGLTLKAFTLDTALR